MSSSFSDSSEPLDPSEAAEQEQEIIASSSSDDPAIVAEPTIAIGEGNESSVEEEGTTSSIPLSPEELLPPEARGEANGGPLGCCLGTVVGLLLTALLTTSLSLAVANGGVLSFATIPVLLIGTSLGGFLGWRIGKRIYKEYELSPRQKRKLAQQQRRLDEMERKRKVTGTRKKMPLS